MNSLNLADEVREIEALCRVDNRKETVHGGNVKHMSMVQLCNSVYTDAFV